MKIYKFREKGSEKIVTCDERHAEVYKSRSDLALIDTYESEAAASDSEDDTAQATTTSNKSKKK